MEIVIVFSVCLAASTIGGICGVGGGVVIKPLLDATGIMSVPTLSFLSGLTVLTMACVNVLRNRIGGGPMNLAVLYYFFSMDTKKAAVNSILVILLSQTASLIFSIVSRTVPAYNWGVLISMMGAGALGGFLSSFLHKKLSVSMTHKLFIGLLAVILAICIYNSIRMLSAVPV